VLCYLQLCKISNSLTSLQEGCCLSFTRHPTSQLRRALFYIPSVQSHYTKTRVFPQYNIYFMALYVICTFNTLSRNKRTTFFLRRFIFIFKRHESRIIQNFPPQQATPWPPSSSLHSRGSTRMYYISNVTNVTNPTLALHHF
jgi:hypothetical protein